MMFPTHQSAARRLAAAAVSGTLVVLGMALNLSGQGKPTCGADNGASICQKGKIWRLMYTGAQ